MNNNQKQQSGYTLIEVIIAVQIFLIVLTMAYTIYLFGYKFMVRWNDDNDLLSTELLIQKSLSNEIATAKEIIEISKNNIIYKDRNYNLQKIYWTKDSLFIKSKPINKSNNKISSHKIKFILNDKITSIGKSFSEIDQNKDNRISNEELGKISVLNFEYLLNNKNKKFNSKLLLLLNK